MKIATLYLLLITTISVAQNFDIAITPGKEWHHSFKMGLFTIKSTPQYAIWLVDSSGNHLETISVTKKSAKSLFSGAGKKSRPEALPVWSFARGKKSSTGNYMPSKKEPLVDGVTSASPKSEMVLSYSLPVIYKDQSVSIRVEINNSMDFNDFYTKQKKNKEGSNNSVNGQPSLIYEAKVPPSDSLITFSLLGVSEPTGKSGAINKVVDHITSAHNILSEISIRRVQ